MFNFDKQDLYKKIKSNNGKDTFRDTCLLQGYSAIMASLTYFAIGEVRSWSSSGIPSLQGKDGQNATLSQGPLPIEVTSWISKYRYLTHTY